MLLKNNKKSLKGDREFSVLPKYSSMLFVMLLLGSLAIHAISLVNFPTSRKTNNQVKKKRTVKIRLVEKVKKKEKIEKDHIPKKILEAKQEETRRPKEARYHGAQNHIAEKETKLKKTQNAERALNPGSSSQKKPISSAKKVSIGKKSKPRKVRAKRNRDKPRPKKSQRVLSSHKSRSSFEHIKKDSKTKGLYKSLLPTSQDLQQQVTAGYQDYIDEKLQEADKVDINTTDYRFIGYFTSMRKAIELAWNYPSASARRGHQGVVGLQFTIFKNGTVRNLKVVQSSGYKDLDRAIVDAIRLTSPFSPLPDGFGKSKMTITGDFRYVLSSYVGH